MFDKEYDLIHLNLSSIASLFSGSQRISNSVIKSLSCDDENIFVNYERGGQCVIKRLDLIADECTVIYQKRQCETNICPHNNGVLICDYFQPKKEKNVGCTNVYYYSLEKEKCFLIRKIKDFKIEAFWPSGNNIIYIGTDRDNILKPFYSVFPYAYSLSKEEINFNNYLRKQHRCFYVYNTVLDKCDKIPLRSEINSRCCVAVNNRFFYTGVNSSTLYVYNTVSKKKSRIARLQNKITFLTSNGDKVIAHCDNSTFVVYDINTLQQTIIENAPGCVDQLVANKTLICSVYGAIISIYDIQSMQMITSINTTFDNESFAITINERYLVWKLSSDKIIIQDCPVVLQEMINEQLDIFRNETIPIEERKRYYMDDFA